MAKIKNTYLVNQLVAAYNRKDGYLMGGKGQRMDTLKYGEGNWLIEQYTGEQHDQALYWLRHAERCWDCNGLLEGIYEQATGIDINARARDNYHSWCNPKGTLPKGKYPLPPAARVPGCCLFSSSTGNIDNITHVGYLYKPVKEGMPEGDWWVIEARGVMYGVVKTKLSGRNWKWWGLPTKYVDFDSAPAAEGDYIVTASNALNVRKGPGTEYDAIDTVHRGDRLIAGARNGWLPVMHDGVIGWVSEKYLEAVR